MNMATDALRWLKKKIETIQPDLIGVSLRNVLTLWVIAQLPHRALCHYIKFAQTYAPDTPILAGGTAFSLFPKRLMEELHKFNVGLWAKRNRIFCPCWRISTNRATYPGSSTEKEMLSSSTHRWPPLIMADYTYPTANCYRSNPIWRSTNTWNPLESRAKEVVVIDVPIAPTPFWSGTCMRTRNPVDVVDEIADLYHPLRRDAYPFNRLHRQFSRQPFGRDLQRID